ncbi:MAG: preprotein translocase subunit Sec61beta [Nanoarchaeota archaeon]
MASDNKISMPGSFGGLMRYDEEYDTKIKISPMQVIFYIVFIILVVFGLNLFWPISG